MNRFVVFLLLQASAQSPGNGISKSTYSCNDPIAAKKWLYKYFTVKTPGDECADDTCVCSATSSTPEWYIQQGRVYVPLSGKSDSLGRRLQDPGNGFGLHCVNVSNHLTTGGLSTAEVEAHFKNKLGDMKEYDSFMDFSVTFYTKDVMKYAAAFDKDGVSYHTTQWESSDDGSSQSYVSLIVQVPNTQMILELTSQKGSAFSGTLSSVAPTERRVSPRALSMIRSLEDQEILAATDLTPLSVNRAVSAKTLAKIEDFYVNGMGTKKVSDNADAAKGYTRKCFLWTGAEVDICFTNRPDNATKGEWKVADFENMLNDVHKNIIVGHPFCRVDKWEDNHYAIDSFSIDTSTIVSYIDKNSVPHVCASSSGSMGGGVSYIFDPTGWGIQADLSFNSLPSDCTGVAQNKSRRLQGPTFNPACEPGTCGTSPPSPTPTPPSPTPAPPTPAPPSPSAHCDQCKRLVNWDCATKFGKDCVACSWGHKAAWYPKGCMLPGCDKVVADACAPEDVIV